MSAEAEFFVPVYDYGQGEDCTGATYGTRLYLDLQELYAYEPEAVGHIVAKGIIKPIPKSGAI